MTTDDLHTQDSAVLFCAQGEGRFVGVGDWVPAPSAKGAACDGAEDRMGDNTATSRLERIVGRDGIQKLARASVLVLGLGGVGSNCVEALARGGVGQLVLVDRDYVQASNINRQALAMHSTLGQRKVDAMRALVNNINPNLMVETYDMALLPGNCVAFMDQVAPQVDYVVDAIDTVATKLELARWAQTTGKPLISSMGAANKVHPECLHFADLYKTQNCPLCRIMRKEGRKRGITQLCVLYSSEHAVQVPSDPQAQRTDRSNLGTMSYMPPIMGQMIAGRILSSIIGLDAKAATS